MNTWIFRTENGTHKCVIKVDFVQAVLDFFRFDDNDAQNLLKLFTGTSIIDQMQTGIGLDKGLVNFVDKIISETIDDTAFEFTCARGWYYEGALRMWSRYFRYYFFTLLCANEIGKKLYPKLNAPPYLPSGYFLNRISLIHSLIATPSACATIRFDLKKNTKNIYGEIQTKRCGFLMEIKNFAAWYDLNGNIVNDNLIEEYVDFIWNPEPGTKTAVYKNDVLIKDVNSTFLKELIK